MFPEDRGRQSIYGSYVAQVRLDKSGTADDTSYTANCYHLIKKMLDFVSTEKIKLLDVLEFLKVLVTLLEFLLDVLESWLFDEKFGLGNGLEKKRPRQPDRGGPLHRSQKATVPGTGQRDRGGPIIWPRLRIITSVGHAARLNANCA